MVTKVWPDSVMYLSHVSINGQKGCPVSVMFLSHVSNSGH